MSIVNSDIDLCIITLLFGTNKRTNHQILQCIYRAFGKSRFSTFVNQCKNFVFKGDKIYSLLQDVTHKNNPIFYPCYREFLKELAKGNPLITFESLNNKSRLIVKYLALYHGYLTVCTNKEMFEPLGYTYSSIHNDVRYKNKPLTFRFLKTKKIHNLEYYDLVEKKDTIYDSTFKLKPGALIYKKGASTEIMDLTCIKII